jgi:hypothetical protein
MMAIMPASPASDGGGRFELGIPQQGPAAASTHASVAALSEAPVAMSTAVYWAR